MCFTVLGDALHSTAGLTHGAIDTVHHAVDDTLDRTGLSAFIPPALHEASDGALGLLQRGVDDFGHTTGDILKSFDKKPLHAHDKSIGGNLRNQSPSGKKRHGSPSPAGKTKTPMCKWCKAKPQYGDFKYCSKQCGREAQRSKEHRR